jgi:hypothetical protein
MAVRFDRWFGVPPEVFQLGFFAKMSPSDIALYFTLCWWSDRKSSRSFEVKDAEMEAHSGLSRRSLHDARKHLSSLGMVENTKNLGGHVYTLCDLKTGLPYPGDPKAKLNWLKKGANGNAVGVEARTTPSGAQGDAVRAGIDKTLELDPSWCERGATAAFDVRSKRSSVPSPTDDTTRKYDFNFNSGCNATADEPVDVTFHYGWNANTDEPEAPIW